MKKRKLAFVFGGLLLALPVLNANGQEHVSPPGSFDPQTATAHEQQTSEPANGPDLANIGNQAPQADVVKTPGRVIVPSSSVMRPGDRGLRAHTNHLIFVPQGMQAPAAAALAGPSNLAPAASATPNYTFPENPGSLGCVYQVGPLYAGCTPSGGFGRHPVGGSGAIAIVDAYNNPYAAADLANFDAEWGLPAPSFTQIYCQPYPGTCYSSNAPPANNTGWGLEEALDIEWAHAMAPSAKILLIEAASNSLTDLAWANAWAGYYVDINGGGEVSNSWGSGEWAGETGFDGYFNNYFGNYHPVVYFASGGDNGTVEYPSASPFVVSAGGTTVNRDGVGNFVSQTCWTGTGRGPSTVEAIPLYQSYVASLAGTKRLTTDLSFDADPASGVWVYDAFNGGWFIVGGTSVASPSLAGVVNNAGNRFSATVNQQNLLYAESKGAKASSLFYDVSPAGYDYCTGIGTPRTLVGK